MKKLFTILAIAICINANAQIINFQNLASMNIKRGAIASAADSNYIYVSNGFSPTSAYTKEIERYDVANNTWSVYATSLVSKRFASSVIVGNNMYLFNGYDSGGVYNNKMEVMNLNTGNITFSTNNPLPTYYSGVAVWDSTIYVFGGSTSSTSCTNKLYSFNTVTQVWTQLAGMTVAKQTGGAIINGKLYALGGFDGFNNSNRIDRYDISTNTWINLGFMSDSVSSFAPAVYGSKIFMAGSFNNLIHLSYYDVNTNTYTILQETGMVGRRNTGAAVINNNLYIVGGNQTSSINSSLSSLQVANLTAVGVEQFTSNNIQINIYPNPANNTLTIQSSTELGIISIYNSLGEKVKEIRTKIQEARVEIDISNLPAGVYTLLEQGRYSKIIKE